jgi:hypothetical protein
MTDRHCEGQRVEPVTSSGCSGLTFKAFADNRDRRNTGRLRSDRGPQHGGRATASTTHPRNDSVYLEAPQLVGKLGEAFTFVAAVQVSEHGVIDDFDAGEALRELPSQDREQLVAAEQVIPEKRNALR